MKTELTSCDIELAVANHFNYRINLIVPNVSWGWGLQHEADLIILRQSGYCDEVEIKVSASDIKADLRKRFNHWEDRRILRVWFAVPKELASCPDIPDKAGILSVARIRNGTSYYDKVELVRPAVIRDKDTRIKITPKERQKLADLAAMRIWDLKRGTRGLCREVKLIKEEMRKAGVA